MRASNVSTGASSLPRAPDAPREPPEPWLAPFAAELGRGTTYAGGFAIGVKRQAEGGAVAEVVLLDADAAQGKRIRLARSRGDLGAPLVVRAGPGVVAGVLEPNASGFSFRLARLVGDSPRWGAEIDQGRDDSFAVDVAIGSSAGAVVWDDADRKGTRMLVLLATVGPDKLEMRRKARPRKP